MLVESNCWNATSSATWCMYSVWLADTCIYTDTSSLPQTGVPKVYISSIWSSPRLICDAVYFLPWRSGCTARRTPSLSVSACRRTPLHKVGSGRPWDLLILAMPLIACDCIIPGLVSEMFPERCASYKTGVPVLTPTWLLKQGCLYIWWCRVLNTAIISAISHVCVCQQCIVRGWG